MELLSKRQFSAFRFSSVPREFIEKWLKIRNFHGQAKQYAVSKLKSTAVFFMFLITLRKISLNDFKTPFHAPEYNYTPWTYDIVMY